MRAASHLVWYCQLFTPLLVLIPSAKVTDKIQNSDSLKSNILSCPWFHAEGLRVSPPENATSLAVVNYSPSADEVNGYSSLPATITSANKALGIGQVKGKPKALIWAQSTTNSWQLPLEHPRNNKSNCVEVSVAVGEQPLKLYEVVKSSPSQFYLIHVYNAIIHDTGTVMLDCGYVQLHEGCETIFKFIGRKWQDKCRKNMTASSVSWAQMMRFPDTTKKETLSACTANGDMPVRYKRVFIISASWDHNYHHFLSDSLSKLSRHIEYLKLNTDIKIHIRMYDQFAKGKAEAGRALRKRLFEAIGIDTSRLVAGPVIADEVFIPRSPKCNAPLGHIYELRLLSQRFQLLAFPEIQLIPNPKPPLGNFGPAGMTQALKYIRRRDLAEATRSDRSNASKPAKAQAKADEGPITPATLSLHRKKVVFAHRPCKPKKGVYQCDAWREWDNATIAAMQTAFANKFPAHEIVVISAGDSRWTDCLACQIRVLAVADVLVGIHGAGLTNMIFLPPAAMVYEIVGVFDGRMLPVCGYHGPLAAGYGVHHFVHYFDWKGKEQLVPEDIASEARSFHDYLLNTKN